MRNRDAMHAEFRDLEEVIRAAGDYVDVADDLRPQTLERSRNKSRRSSARFRIAVVAVIVVFVAMSVGMLRVRLASTPPLVASVSADGDQLYAVARQKAAQANVDPSWSLVDAFRELRRRQVRLIESAF